MFFNKYCENINLPSASNRFADVVVDFETSRKIIVDEKDDCSVDEDSLEEDEEELTDQEHIEDKNQTLEFTPKFSTEFRDI